MAYHQTNDLTQAQQSQYEEAAITQENRILSYLREQGPVYAFACHTLEEQHVLPAGVPHSSYIRALANLRSEGRITKISQIKGPYGRPVNVYLLTGGARA